MRKYEEKLVFLRIPIEKKEVKWYNILTGAADGSRDLCGVKSGALYETLKGLF